MADDKRCRTCKYRILEDENGWVFICSNKFSECYRFYIHSDDCCDEWEN